MPRVSTAETAAAIEQMLADDSVALAPVALEVARLAYPMLDPAPYLRRLQDLGADARAEVEAAGDDHHARIAAINGAVFERGGFGPNRDQYLDPRNSFLNEVLDRRLGIPITLSIIYIDVARAAGVPLEGISFPGHFLVRYSLGDSGATIGRDLLVIDPFNRGRLLSQEDCLALVREHLGAESEWDPSLLRPATRRQIVLRMLANLKRAYVALRSFPQARDVSNLLVALSPNEITEIRDRGLLAYHLQDFHAALRDLEEYVRLAPKTADSSQDEETREELQQLWDHIKNLRRRVASLN